ncbi:2OG-Fe(II) oxygenase [Nocardia sp. NPDC127579]|uniref:2OG-Fe(II) oxygenase n=1 Tax=Nocardia sp. NPDC127579 TaxID=3345402 RepID=UPI00362DE581
MTGVMETPAPALPEWFTELFAHRRWVRRATPFPHVYVRDVFVEEFYQRLSAEYQRVRRDRGDEFHVVNELYSADAISLTKLRNGPLALFGSREWHDLIAGVMGVAGTGDIEGAVHHHPPDSPRGWPHSDLAPAWFAGDPPVAGETRLPDGEVDIQTGERESGVAARELVRGVAIMFYLANDPAWAAGDGGETALFAHVNGRHDPEPDLLVPPLNNSMVMFECTPRSWHTFAGHNVADRNCLVMWLHRPRSEAVRRWGENHIVTW